MNTGEMTNLTGQIMALVLVAVLAVGVWFLGAMALKRLGPWRGDRRAFKLAGLLVGTGLCLLFVLMFAVTLGLNEGVTLNARAYIGLAVAMIGLPTLGFLAYRLDRDIRHPKSHA